MKSYFRFTAFALLGLFLISGSAFAAVTHTDGDIYGDPYTVESSSGNWTMAGNHTVQGNLTVSGNITNSGTGTGKKNVVLVTNAGLAATSGTVGTVTIARSGYMFVLTAPSLGQAYPSGVGMTLSLPSTNTTVGGTFTGERFTFTTATGTTLSVRCAASTDGTIMYGPTNCTRVTSPASSGSTITLVGFGTSWYIEAMNGGSGVGQPAGSTGGSTGSTVWVTGTA